MSAEFGERVPGIPRPDCLAGEGVVVDPEDEELRGLLNALPPELACLQCGWRRVYSPRQFERRLGLSSATDDDRYALTQVFHAIQNFLSGVREIFPLST